MSKRVCAYSNLEAFYEKLLKATSLLFDGIMSYVLEARSAVGWFKY